MVLVEDRPRFDFLMRSARLFADTARKNRIAGDLTEARKNLARAAMARGKAWELAKPICMMCWKDAQIMRQWRSEHINGWCLKCAEWYPN